MKRLSKLKSPRLDKRSQTPMTKSSNEITYSPIRSLSPFSKLERSIDKFDDKLSAVIPCGLGKIQKSVQYFKDLKSLYNLDEEIDDEALGAIEKYLNNKKIDSKQPIYDRSLDVTTQRISSNSFHRLKKNPYSPGMIRVYPKDLSVLPNSTLTSKTPKIHHFSPRSLKALKSPKTEYRLAKLSSENVKKTNTEKLPYLQVEKYKGDYFNGKRHGYGEIEYNNGDKYAGN